MTRKRNLVGSPGQPNLLVNGQSTDVALTAAATVLCARCAQSLPCTMSSAGTVPETVLKKRKRDEEWAQKKATAAADTKKSNKNKRKDVFKRAEQYVKEYRQQVFMAEPQLAETLVSTAVSSLHNRIEGSATAENSHSCLRLLTEAISVCHPAGRRQHKFSIPAGCSENTLQTA